MRLRKKKLLKSYKSKIRFAQKDLAQKHKQDNWQSFLKGKGSKKKTGFLTGGVVLCAAAAAAAVAACACVHVCVRACGRAGGACGRACVRVWGL